MKINTNGTQDQLRESIKANKASRAALVECYKANTWETNYGTSGGPVKAVADLVERIGIDAARVVVAEAVLLLHNDGRISDKNREWARSVEGIEEVETLQRFGFMALTSYIHPAHLDSLADQMRNYTPTEPKTEAEPAAEETTEEATTTTETATASAGVTVAENAEHGGIEIAFGSRPASDVLDLLKGAGFRWHSARRVWYAKADETRRALAVRLACGQTVAEIGRTPEKAQKTRQAGTPQDHVRIYWNGIKIDGGKLIRCGYSFEADGSEVRIYARDYADLPRDLFEVHNDTDLYTDYFDDDRATVKKSHPLHKYLLFAAMKAQARMDRPYCEKLRESLKGREPWPGHFEALRHDLARREAFLTEFDKMTDPGQPTAEDLAEIDRQATERENARRAAEEQAERDRQEAFVCRRGNALHLVREAKAAHPLKDGEPVVVLEWSEHPGLFEGERLSVPAAEIVLGTLDAEEHADRIGGGGYFKTAFRIEWTDENGEASTYTGRYDLGDGDGGLAAHVAAWAEWCRTHDTFGHETENPEPETDLTRFAAWLTEKAHPETAAA